MFKPIPLPKNILEECKKQGVTSFTLQFTGGNDEGYLDVEFDTRKGGYHAGLNDLSKFIESWAWDVYGYNGAGDGNEYGDSITYDLVQNKIQMLEWWHSRQEAHSEPEKIVIGEDYQSE